MDTVTISSKYQMVIPRAIREILKGMSSDIEKEP
jgi:bifunctional DNA-binding transcriptional regulator/antitoxin component of YhaV-PrlF toxin-antitoxin module